MIILDTHIWVWFVNNKSKISNEKLSHIEENIDSLAISIISCWEVCKLVELGRLNLDFKLETWLKKACSFSGLKVLDLDINVCIGSTTLPGKFHRDPMDQIIVATARYFDCPLVTADSKILNYSHVKTI